MPGERRNHGMTSLHKEGKDYLLVTCGEDSARTDMKDLLI